MGLNLALGDWGYFYLAAKVRELHHGPEAVALAPGWNCASPWTTQGTSIKGLMVSISWHFFSFWGGRWVVLVLLHVGACVELSSKCLEALGDVAQTAGRIHKVDPPILGFNTPTV